MDFWPKVIIDIQWQTKDENKALEVSEVEIWVGLKPFSVRGLAKRVEIWNGKLAANYRNLTGR